MRGFFLFLLCLRQFCFGWNGRFFVSIKEEKSCEKTDERREWGQEGRLQGKDWSQNFAMMRRNLPRHFV